MFCSSKLTMQSGQLIIVQFWYNIMNLWYVILLKYKTFIITQGWLFWLFLDITNINSAVGFKSLCLIELELYICHYIRLISAWLCWTLINHTWQIWHVKCSTSKAMGGKHRKPKLEIAWLIPEKSKVRIHLFESDRFSG